MSKILLYKAGDAASHKQIGKELSELKPGDYVIEIKRNRPVRSMSQNKYYHFILKIIGIYTGHTHEELHEALKLKFNSVLITFPKGGQQLIGASTSNLATDQFTAYINRVKQWALDEFALLIPDAGQIDYNKWIEAENQYEKVNSGW